MLIIETIHPLCIGSNDTFVDHQPTCVCEGRHVRRTSRSNSCWVEPTEKKSVMKCVRNYLFFRRNLNSRDFLKFWLWCDFSHFQSVSKHEDEIVWLFWPKWSKYNTGQNNPTVHLFATEKHDGGMPFSPVFKNKSLFQFYCPWLFSLLLTHK